MSHRVLALRSRRPRRLGLELLERRELLSVTVLGETWKSFAFTGSSPSLSVSGTYTYSGYPIPFKSTSTSLHGTATYTSTTQGTITIDTLTASGTWSTPLPTYHGNFSLTNGQNTNAVDKAGAFSGQAAGNLDISLYTGKDLANTTMSGAVSGSISGPQETVGTKLQQGPLVVNVNGPIQPQASEPFHVQVTSAALSHAEWLALLLDREACLANVRRVVQAAGAPLQRTCQAEH